MTIKIMYWSRLQLTIEITIQIPHSYALYRGAFIRLLHYQISLCIEC